MNEQLKYLIQLQALENKKKALMKEKEEAPKKRALKEKEFSEFEAEFVMKKNELDSVRKLHKELEQEVSQLEQKLRKSKAKEQEVKTNKEYRALLKEQEDLKQEIIDREDRILECMEKIEILSQEVKKLEKEVKAKKEELEKELLRLEQETLEIDKKIETLEKIQAEIKEKLEPQYRKRCEFLMVRQGGIAVAPVEKGICKVCHVSLPPQQFIELQKDKSIMNCPHCHRFIYWPGHSEYMEAADEIVHKIVVSTG